MAGESHKRCVLFRASHLETHGIYLPFTDDANFDSLVKGVA